MLGSELSDGAKSLLSRVGQAQLDGSEAERTAAASATNAIKNWLGEFAIYRAQPWLNPDGKQVQIPVTNTGDPFSDRAALIGHELLEPNAPLMRPGTNADWIDPLITLTSAGALGAGVVLGTAGAAAGVVEGGGVAALDATADSVWSLMPIQRGIAIEQKLATTEYADWYWIGQKNNGYFPLIDFQQGDSFVSLRTVDTNGVSWFRRHSRMSLGRRFMGRRYCSQAPRMMRSEWVP